MTELDLLIEAAFASEGRQADVNKVYLSLLKAPLFIPVKKEKNRQEEGPFSPLFTQLEDNIYMLAFDTVERLNAWAKECIHEIDYVEISGHDLMVGIQDAVYLGLNLGSRFYKEFSPEEIHRIKMIVSKLEQLKNPATN